LFGLTRCRHSLSCRSPFAAPMASSGAASTGRLPLPSRPWRPGWCRASRPWCGTGRPLAAGQRPPRIDPQLRL